MYIIVCSVCFGKFPDNIFTALLYFAKWYFATRNEICSLRNGNLSRNARLLTADQFIVLCKILNKVNKMS